MKKRYYLLASMFMLASLPLVAESLPSEGEEIALESQETAQFGNRRTGGTKSRKCLECECKEPEVLVVPEEIAIESQRNVITPSVYPYISKGMNLTGSVAFIWWQSKVGNSGYAYSGTADGDLIPLGTSVSSGVLQNPDFGFEPGVKVGLGGHFDHDGWDLSAEYIYLPGSGENALNEIGEKTRIAITTGDGVVAPLSIIDASCDWTQNYNLINLELGRNFFISKYLTLRPHIGFNTAWISEKYSLAYAPVPTATDPRLFGFGNNITNVAVTEKQSMWGIGIRGGIDTMWHFTRCWALYGDLALTSFWGRFHVKNSCEVTETLEGTYETLHLNYTTHTLVPVIETGLGLAYITWFNEDRLRMQVQLGWEQQIWTDFNYFTQGQGYGNLAIQGMTLKAGLTF